MTSKTIEQYLSDAFDEQLIDHSLRAHRDPLGNVTFYVHPSNASGDTLTFSVRGNRLVFPQRAEHTLQDDFAHFLAYSGLAHGRTSEPLADLLMAYADGRDVHITRGIALELVGPIIEADSKPAPASDIKWAASVTVPPLDGRVPVVKPTPASIEARVADINFHQWPGSTMITCKVTAHNGHEYTADSKPIDAADFTVERGQEESRKKAVAQLWDAAINEYRTACMARGVEGTHAK